jgi:hypothetical protein
LSHCDVTMFDRLVDCNVTMFDTLRDVTMFGRFQCYYIRHIATFGNVCHIAMSGYVHHITT